MTGWYTLEAGGGNALDSVPLAVQGYFIDTVDHSQGTDVPSLTGLIPVLGLDSIEAEAIAKQKVFSAEQIIMKLRQTEVLLSQKKSVKEACQALEISEQTYYRWHIEYGGLDPIQAKKL